MNAFTSTRYAPARRVRSRRLGDDTQGSTTGLEDTGDTAGPGFFPGLDAADIANALAEEYAQDAAQAEEQYALDSGDLNIEQPPDITSLTDTMTEIPAPAPTAPASTTSTPDNNSGGLPPMAPPIAPASSGFNLDSEGNVISKPVTLPSNPYNLLSMTVRGQQILNALNAGKQPGFSASGSGQPGSAIAPLTSSPAASTPGSTASIPSGYAAAPVSAGVLTASSIISGVPNWALLVLAFLLLRGSR
jgi:hypothetical protein